jgi:hypothetical protein
MDIQSILRHNGLDIAPSKRTTPGKLVAVAALDQVYTQMGPAALRMVIEIIVAAWGTDDSRAYVGSMLLGMAVFLLRYSNKLDRSRLIEKLQTVTPARLMAEAVFERGGRSGSPVVQSREGHPAPLQPRAAGQLEVPAARLDRSTRHHVQGRREIWLVPTWSRFAPAYRRSSRVARELGH